MEEEAQAVLLESMGTQYIIQRADGESLQMGKGVPLFSLNGELISEGMVVDMINDVGSEYNAGGQYYETEDDLLPHVLTEVCYIWFIKLIVKNSQSSVVQMTLYI